MHKFDTLITEQVEFMLTESLFDILEMINESNRMSDRETKRLLRKYKETGDTDARNELITGNMALVYSFAKRMYMPGKGYEWDDLVQTGVMAIIRAIDRFELDRDTKFSVFLYRTVEGLMKNFINQGVQPKIHSIDAEVEKEMGHRDNEIVNALKDKEDSAFEKLSELEDIGIMKKILKRLPRNKRWAIESYFGLGDTEKMKIIDIADQLGITKAGASLMIKRALESIQKQMG